MSDLVERIEKLIDSMHVEPDFKQEYFEKTLHYEGLTSVNFQRVSRRYICETYGVPMEHFAIDFWNVSQFNKSLYKPSD